MASLPADATVTFADERRSAGIDEVLDALDGRPGRGWSR